MSDSSRRKKNPGKIYLICGLLFFAFFLLLYFPAARAYILIEEKVPAVSRHLGLSGLEGPWFAGSARKGQLGQIPVRRINWRFRPSLSAWFQADISFRSRDNGYFRALVAAGPGQAVSCSDISGRLPLQLFQEILSRYGLKMEGSASLAVERLHLENGYFQEAEGGIVLSRVRLLSPQTLSLGDFKVEMTTTGKQIKTLINDSGGPLSVEGVLMVQNDGSYSFSGTFAARERENPELQSILRLLGQPGEDGTVTVDLSGRLKPLFS